MRKYLPLISTIAAFVAEWYLLNYLVGLVESGKETTFWAFLVLLIPIPLWFIVWLNFRQAQHNKKQKTGRANRLPLLLPFIRIVKAEVVTANGIIGVLFILFNLAWTQDLLIQAIKGDGSWHYPLFTFLCLAVPFVWPSVPKAKADTVSADQRKVLITGVGHVPKNPPMSQDYQGWTKKWEPIRACFDRYPNLEKVLIIHSSESAELSETNSSSHSLKTLLQDSISSELDVEEKQFADLNDYNVLFPDLRKMINVFVAEHGYKDKEIMFVLTSGPAVLTAGLTFLSMAGPKGGVYSRQEEGLSPVERLTEFEVDLYSADELWQEIVRKADKD